jgi:hypothetical protein
MAQLTGEYGAWKWHGHSTVEKRFWLTFRLLMTRARVLGGPCLVGAEFMSDSARFQLLSGKQRAEHLYPPYTEDMR